METTTCNLCGTAQWTNLFTVPDFLLGREDVQATFVKCAQCGLIYQNPRPTPEEMGRHYPSEYELFSSAPDSTNTSWMLSRAVHYGMGKRAAFVTRHKKAGRLLDVGCAIGSFMNEMRQRPDWEVEGIEVSEVASRIARERYGLPVRTGTLEQAQLPSDCFDVVTMWDVLEHVHDPKATLREVRRILKPSGVLVARVPNASGWDARIFGRYWAGFEPPRHLYVFTPRVLGKILSDCALTPSDWSSGTAAYTTFLLSLRFWARRHKVDDLRLDARISLLYHPLMRLLSAPVFYLLGLGVRGPQVVVTAFKNAASNG